MSRKKWTAQTDVTEELLAFREKRKWQLSYRRYVLERKPSQKYSRYFGLEVEELRQWFEIQFTPGINWDNYAKAWQFGHIVPTQYFNFSNEKDLQLCWSFINMRVEKIYQSKEHTYLYNLLSAKNYFLNLYNKTKFLTAERMYEKISEIESSATFNSAVIEEFIIQNKSQLEAISTLNQDEFHAYTEGTSIPDILLEREMLRKFG